MGYLSSVAGENVELETASEMQCSVPSRYKDDA